MPTRWSACPDSVPIHRKPIAIAIAMGLVGSMSLGANECRRASRSSPQERKHPLARCAPRNPWESFNQRNAGETPAPQSGSGAWCGAGVPPAMSPTRIQPAMIVHQKTGPRGARSMVEFALGYSTLKLCSSTGTKPSPNDPPEKTSALAQGLVKGVTYAPPPMS